jgi:hypothetical protein
VSKTETISIKLGTAHSSAYKNYGTRFESCKIVPEFYVDTKNSTLLLSIVDTTCNFQLH